jgi:tRNA-Thr(GGU) m(6)t(6)A37 methyltransferase TsaA
MGSPETPPETADAASTPPDRDATRPGEVAAPVPDGPDAGLVFIGHVETPFRTRRDCPRQGRHDGPPCRLVLHAPYERALVGLDAFETIEVLYWLHAARRDLLVQCPHHDGVGVGTFALRSPLRPNPIGTSLVRLVAIDGPVVTVRGLDCLDGTPLLDIKPDRCAYTPRAFGNGGA